LSKKAKIQIDRSDRLVYFHYMKTIASYEAKSKFSEILREAAAGEIFVITRNGQRMAELRPCPTSVPQRKRGMMKKAFGPVPPDFNEPLNDFAEYQ
jgi:antitoxin (DNA-binding transcriptional repressor) of toxin-antitoxin stability system